MELSISGRIIEIMPPQQGSGTKGPWTKLGYVLKTTGQYSKAVAFEYWKGDPMIQVGHDVTIHFNAESRHYQGKWYTTLTAWKIHVHPGNPANASQPYKVSIDDSPEKWGDPNDDDDNSPPF